MPTALGLEAWADCRQCAHSEELSTCRLASEMCYALAPCPCIPALLAPELVSLQHASPGECSSHSLSQCAGDLSRNRTVGLRLGKGESLEEITAGMKAVAEGILTSRAAHELAAKLQVQAPIIDGIFRVIHQQADPVAVVTEVMSRR